MSQYDRIGIQLVASEYFRGKLAMANLLSQFKRLFGNSGGDVLPANVGRGRTVVEVCQELIEKANDSVLFDYFATWDSREPGSKPLDVELALVQRGQWEGAWALAQLHYNQMLKKEARTKERFHKGHPLCGLAIIGRQLGSPALERHFALLSSAGDIYWQHQDKALKFGGFGPTILEQYESHAEHKGWRKRILGQLQQESANVPLHLEAFLAARWFAGPFGERITDCAKVTNAKPFIEVLLDHVESNGSIETTTRGTLFEAAAGLLLSRTPGFEVRSARRTSDEQVDLVVGYQPDRLSRITLPHGPGLIECKSSEGRVSVTELRDFGAKCQFHRVGFGILIARAGITGGGNPEYSDPEYSELVRRRFLVDGMTVLVLDISHLRNRSHQLRGLQDALAADHDWLTFGPVAGSKRK